MSFPFDIPCGSPLVAIEAWTPDDLVQFAHRAAAGLDSSMLAQVSAIEEQAVEALLAEPVIAALVEEYGRMLAMSDEEFRARLRPFVRMVIEHEVRKPKPKGPFLFYLFFCLEIAGKDPVQEIIKSLLSSLRRKREITRRARAAAPPPRPFSRQPDRRVEPGTSGNLGFETKSRREGLENRSELNRFMRIAEDLATKRSAESGVSRGVRPTEKELLAENMVRFANRGRRILAARIAEELADRVEAGAIQRPSIQHQTIEKESLSPPDKVIEGCGDRVVRTGRMGNSSGWAGEELADALYRDDDHERAALFCCGVSARRRGRCSRFAGALE